jgi:hypothetical protein
MEKTSFGGLVGETSGDALIHVEAHNFAVVGILLTKVGVESVVETFILIQEGEY